MKTGFDDPIGVPPGKRIKTPWNFDQPPYDERTSCYVSAGTNYGVGINQPVGHKGDPKQKVSVLPQNTYSVNTLEVAHVKRGRVSNMEIEENE